MKLNRYSLVEDHYWGGKAMFGGEGHQGDWVEYKDVAPLLEELERYREAERKGGLIGKPITLKRSKE